MWGCAARAKESFIADCCEEIEVSVENDAAILHNAFMGEYSIADEVNGRRYYTSTTGEQAIWYNKKHNSWAVGVVSDLGTEMRSITSEDGQSPECPNNVTAWMYFDTEKFVEGGNDITIACKEKGTKECIIGKWETLIVFFSYML